MFFLIAWINVRLIGIRNSFFKSSRKYLALAGYANRTYFAKNTLFGLSCQKMVNGNCAVVGCTNSRYKIKVWEKKDCDKHSGQVHKDCPCLPPFHLHIFPSKLLNSEKRNEWIRLVKRTRKGNKEWTPGQSDMVCSKHFVNGRPTLENPNPSLELGYEKPAKKARRVLVRNDSFAAKSVVEDSVPDKSDSLQTVSFGTPEEHGSAEVSKEQCQSCSSNKSVIGSLVKIVGALSKEKTDLKVTVNELSKELESLKVAKKEKDKRPMSTSLIKTDSKMKFYSGIQSVAIFMALFALLKPFLPKLVFWRGSKTIISTKVKNSGCNGVKTQKVCGKDQFLLVLMRLRLGLLNEDLADRFQISSATCSRIFSTWIRFLSRLLGNALIVWLPREVIRTNLPDVFQGCHSKARCIIDCTEIFIERPKAVDIQAATWSEYKQHNTVKFLIGIAPSGFVTYLSDGYGGRTSDRYICQVSGFYKLLEYGDEIMADRGFQIRDDLLHYYCSLCVPPGARAKSQFSDEACKETKTVANLRIHVERAINRIKTFRILKNIFPITLLPFVDDIVRTCAAICNIQPPLIKPKMKKK